ncbi:MAG: protein kinase domain-containing protein [Chloroflexota bacterium]
MPTFDFVLAGRYRLIAPLGEGGMAAVYRARDLRLNREIAVKILNEELTRDPEFLARFQREAQFVASLSHPNIVPVYDVGEEQGSHFIVMEYIRGRTLKDALEANGPMPAERAVRVMEQVLSALGYAHQKGLVHRDVKPHNILLTPDGTAQLTDFGIAHLIGGSSTRTAAVLGSAHYLSPEQARGGEATVASDIYGCGVVLYELLAGKPPFDGTNALAIAHQHVHSGPPPLPLTAGASPHLSDTVMRALAKEPADRFAGTEAFTGALRESLSSTDLEATSIAALPADGGTQVMPLVHGTVPREQRVDHDGMLLRRSPRKVALLAILCLAAVILASYVARLSFMGYALPRYPSLPYASVPLVLAVGLLLAWLHVRSWSYRMDGNAAVLQWGLLSHRRFGVPVRSITTLELKQSMIDRSLGVGTVELCARDQHGKERRLILEDLPHPRETYDDLMQFLGRAIRTYVAPPEPQGSVQDGRPR